MVKISLNNFKDYSVDNLVVDDAYYCAADNSIYLIICNATVNNIDTFIKLAGAYNGIYTYTGEEYNNISVGIPYKYVVELNFN